jgi:RHS repeat-associated protein
VHPVNPVRPEADRVFEYGSPSDSDLLARGRLKRIDDSEGFDAYAYDEAGNIAGHERVVAGRSFVFGRSYDPLGRVIGTTYPDGEFVSWHHDKRLLTRIDSARIAPDAYLADASYDAQARVTNVRLGRNAQNPVIQQTWVYDNVTDGLDRTFAIRTQDSSQIANLDYTVDGIGRVRGTVFTTRRVSDEVQLTNSFSYQLDGLGRISQVVGQLGAGPSIHDFVYDGLGNLTRMADNGVSGSELQYQDPMRPNAVTRAAPIGSGTTRDFTYDPAGRVSSQIYSGTISGVTRPLEYDSQGRPTRAGDFYFGYDAFGERVRTYALPGGGDGKIVHPERDYSFEGDKGTKHFFLDGRRIASAAVSFIPPSAESPFAATVGRPPTVTAPLDAKSVAAIWLIAAAILCAAGLARASRRPISSRLTAMTLVAALGPFLMGSRARVPFGTHSEDRIFYVTDHLGGTILAVTNTGTLRNRFLYHPFGQRRSAEGPALEKQWIGGSFLMAPFVEYQAIYSFGPRLYDPNVGRFLQPDPLIGSPEAPQSLNAYGYALNSPFDAKDPSGYGPECEDTVGGCGPVGGSGLGAYNDAFCFYFGCGLAPAAQDPVYRATNVPHPYAGQSTPSLEANCPGCHFGNRFDPYMTTDADAWVAWDTTNKLLAILPALAAAARPGATATAIQTPFGPAAQAGTPAAIAARTQVSQGATLWRAGTTRRSAAGEGQFWALEHPMSRGYSARYGVPAQNLKNANFIESAVVKPGGPFVTRPAPGVGASSGGGIEVVVPPGGVQMRGFSHLGNQ